MGMTYGKLDFGKRCEICRLREADVSPREAGRTAGRSESTISRILARNSLPRGGYKHGLASCFALSRHPRWSQIEHSSPPCSYVFDCLGWDGHRSRSQAGSSSKEQSTPSASRHSTASSFGPVRNSRRFTVYSPGPRQHAGGVTSLQSAP